MFIKGHNYNHIRTLDIDIHVIEVTYHDPIYIKLKVLYILRRTGDTIVPRSETVKIYRKDFKYWKANESG